MNDLSQIAYVNGSFVPHEEARISIFDRGFLLADAIYEVSAVIGGKLIDNDLHLARLQRSVDSIALALPVTLERVQEIQAELIRLNALKEGGVYLQVTRGIAERDFPFPAGAEPSLVMFTQHKNLLQSKTGINGLTVKTVPDLRWARRDIKSVGLLAQVLAKQMAVDAGCQEAWMVEDGFITEGASSTAYIVTTARTIVTRPSSQATLAGCTWQALKELIREENLQLELRRFSIVEAGQAAEAFLTSASSLVTPIITIDGKPVGSGVPGPLTKRLRELYIARALAAA